jgi:hypothetical protein
MIFPPFYLAGNWVSFAGNFRHIVVSHIEQAQAALSFAEPEKLPRFQDRLRACSSSSRCRRPCRSATCSERRRLRLRLSSHSGRLSRGSRCMHIAMTQEDRSGLSFVFWNFFSENDSTSVFARYHSDRYRLSDSSAAPRNTLKRQGSVRRCVGAQLAFSRISRMVSSGIGRSL